MDAYADDGDCRGILKASGLAIKPRLCSWRTHVQRNHYPFRKDCRICQEAAAKGGAHYRQRLPPKAGVLSVDIGGPFKPQPDMERGSTATYMLVGAITWPTGTTGEDLEHEDVPEPDAPLWHEEAEEVTADGEKKRGRPRNPRSDDDTEQIEDSAEEVPERVERADGHLEGEDDGEPAPQSLHDGDPGLEPGGDDEVQVQVHRIAIPLNKRSQDSVLAGIMELYLHLRAEGMIVRQLHSDRAAEFRSKRLQRWCKERDILQTWTAGDEPQSNGRAEKAVQDVKRRVRTLLCAAAVGEEWWPAALRHLNETWRRDRLGIPGEVPPFMSSVLVRRRYWKTKELDPPQERVKYLAPSWRHHGHWVLREDGTRVLSRMVIQRTTEPITNDAWVAVLEQLNPLEARRRIRGKTAIHMAAVNGGEQDDQGGPANHLKWERVVEEEMMRLVTGDAEVASVVLRSIQKLEEQIAQEPEEDKILQTKIVSLQEVRQRAEAWDKAISAELTSLFETNGALKIVDEDEAKHLIRQEQIQPVPSKCVFTIKPEAGNVKGKKKCRLVACGNYAAEDPAGDYFAAGADAASLRTAICYAAHRGWHGINLDVRTAFLHAPMAREDSEAEAQRQQRVLIKPPAILVQLGYFKPGTYLEVKKALYGFRQSPRLWGDYRDDKLRILTAEGMRLEQLDSEPSLWLVRRIVTEEVEGLLLTYVDDLLVMGAESTVRAWCQAIQQVWDTSTPEWVKPETPTRFLGMELYRGEDGTWRATQENYTIDVLNRNLGRDQSSWPKRKVPMVKETDPESDSDASEQGGEPEGDDSNLVELIRKAQKAVGEVNWLVTRCRPDIMYTVSKMASHCTKDPARTLKMANYLWRYLAETYKEGLEFKKLEDMELRVSTDASYGREPHGCVIVQWGEAPILWRSSKQGLTTTSTGAAELVEIMEGAVMMEAARVLVEEILEKRVAAWQLTDSSAALAIVAGDTSSWKTRHLRKRARYLRLKVSRGEIALRHCPGLTMVADIGTKPLHAPRLETLKESMGMYMPKRHDNLRKEDDGQKDDAGGLQEENHKVMARTVRPTREADQQMLQMAVALAALMRAAGQKDHEELGSLDGWTTLWVTLAVIGLSGMITLLSRRFEGTRSASSRRGINADPPTDDLANAMTLKEDLVETREDRAVVDYFSPIDDPTMGPDNVEAVNYEVLDQAEDPGSGSDVNLQDIGLDENQEAMMPFHRAWGIYVSPGGKCYHNSMLCRGFARASTRMSWEFCDECREVFQEGMTLAEPDGLRILHLDGAHGLWERSDIILRKFRPCRLCIGRQVEWQP